MCLAENSDMSGSNCIVVLYCNFGGFQIAKWLWKELVTQCNFNVKQDHFIFTDGDI